MVKLIQLYGKYVALPFAFSWVVMPLLYVCFGCMRWMLIKNKEAAAASSSIMLNEKNTDNKVANKFQRFKI
jgi:hypothetical protein